jgi:hypothetical protein
MVAVVVRGEEEGVMLDPLVVVGEGEMVVVVIVMMLFRRQNHLVLPWLGEHLLWWKRLLLQQQQVVPMQMSIPHFRLMMVPIKIHPNVRIT